MAEFGWRLNWGDKYLAAVEGVLKMCKENNELSCVERRPAVSTAVDIQQNRIVYSCLEFESSMFNDISWLLPGSLASTLQYLTILQCNSGA